MDLHKVTFPTFVLEPRSMLERITDFMSHPDLIFGYVWRRYSRVAAHDILLNSAENCDDPEERFIRVLQYYLAGWHIKPKGVKKPCVQHNVQPCTINLDDFVATRYNPVLGEFFRCRYDYPDGTKGFYIAEQGTSPPPSSGACRVPRRPSRPDIDAD